MANADRIIDLLHEARARTNGAELDRFLSDSCGDDEDLKAQILSLLQAETDEGQSDFLKNPGVARPHAAAVVEKRGDRIGRYKLIEQIGEGGCGVVYMAEQEEPVRRRVALKVIKVGMDTKQVIARFEAERQALAMMDHPNIAKVLDGGATEAGRPFFVMELVRGIKITDYCDENHLSTRARMELFIKVCQAVQHAHQKGVIHRDLKPSNVLVTQHDDVGVPKIIDFGIAKATTGQLTDSTLLTAFAQFLGTPAYMSPEQAQMSGMDVDTRTDIYSLGVLLYELLTGKTPFDAKALLDGGLDEMRRTIREEEPVRPSARLGTMRSMDLATAARLRGVESPKLIHLISGDLDWVVMKCLDKDRTRRYQAAIALAADLQRNLDDEPVEARPPSGAYRLQKLVRRNKLAFAAGAAVAIALVGGVIVSSGQAIRAKRAEEYAKQRVVELAAERDAKEVSRKEAEAISTFLTEVFESPAPWRDGRAVTVAETLDRAVARLAEQNDIEPARRAALHRTLGVTYLGLGLHRKAIPLLEEARAYHRSVGGLDDRGFLRGVIPLSDAYRLAGRLGEWLQVLEDDVARFPKVFGSESPETLIAINDLALAYAAAGRTSEAIERQEEVVRLYRKTLGPQDPSTLHAVISLAGCYRAGGQHKRAAALLEELLPVCSTILGARHPDTIWTMHSLAQSYRQVDRLEEARALLEKTLALAKDVLGPEHPNTLRMMHMLAAFNRADQRWSDALILREELLPLRQKVLGPQHLDTLWTMHDLAISYGDDGRLPEAIALAEKVFAARTEVLGASHAHTRAIADDLAQMRQRNERPPR